MAASQYMGNPRKNHWQVVKCILWYIRDTADVGQLYDCNKGISSCVAASMVLVRYLKLRVILSTKEVEYMV